MVVPLLAPDLHPLKLLLLRSLLKHLRLQLTLLVEVISGSVVDEDLWARDGRLGEEEGRIVRGTLGRGRGEVAGEGLVAPWAGGRVTAKKTEETIQSM